jgi:hypothetical protein
LDDLSLGYLSTNGQTGDNLNQPKFYLGDAILSARLDYLQWTAEHPAHKSRTYARVVPGPFGWKFLQYWFYYYYNPKLWGPPGFGIAGNHEGDWEWVQIQLDSANRPLGVAASQHGDGEQCDFSTLVEKTALGRPAIYVAHESHANYFWAGSHEVEWNTLRDTEVTRFDGPEYWQTPNITDFSDSPPNWIASWDGLWGGSDNSPGTPGSQLAWDDPWGWQSQQAVACRDRPYPPSPLSGGADKGRLVKIPDSRADGSAQRPALPRIRGVRIVSGTRYGKAVRLAYVTRGGDHADCT